MSGPDFMGRTGEPLPPGLKVDNALDAIVCRGCGLVVLDMAAATKITDPMELRRFVGDAITKHTCGTVTAAAVDVDLARLRDKIEHRREHDQDIPPHVLHRFDVDTNPDGDDTTCMTCGNGWRNVVHYELAELIDAHRAEILSEGQVAKILDIDRVDVRLLRDLLPPAPKHTAHCRERRQHGDGICECGALPLPPESTEAAAPCAECNGETIQFRGRGLQSEHRVCSRWKEPGHLTEGEIRERLATFMEAERPRNRDGTPKLRFA